MFSAIVSMKAPYFLLGQEIKQKAKLVKKGIWSRGGPKTEKNTDRRNGNMEINHY